MQSVKSILEEEFVPLRGSETVKAAKERMESEQVTVLPVVDRSTDKLVGQVSYEQLLNADDEVNIAELDLAKAIRIFEGQHIFVAARLILQHELSLLPLVDDEVTFLGMIAKLRLLEAISRMLNLGQTGSVVTIELDPIDFSISEIVQIIEAEGAKILGIAVESPDQNHRTFEVSVKLNIKDISRITAALKRYDYSVITESESSVLENDLEYRADELIKYIDM